MTPPVTPIDVIALLHVMMWVTGAILTALVVVIWWLFRKIWSKIEELDKCVDRRLDKLHEIRREAIMQTVAWRTTTAERLARLEERSDRIISLLEGSGWHHGANAS